MTTGLYILNDDGKRLRDEAIAKLPKAWNASRNQLWAQVFEAMHFPKDTLRKVLNDQPVRLSSLSKFFGVLERHLDGSLAF